MLKKTNNKTIRPFDGIRRAISRNTNVEIENSASISTSVSSGMTFSVFKMAGVCAIALILLTSLSSVGGTIAYYTDIERSIANKLQAGILFLSLSSGENQRLAASENIGAANFYVTLEPNETNLPLVYTVTGELDSTNPSGCNSMQLAGNFNGYHYDGNVTGLSTAATSTLGQWSFLATLPTTGTGLAPNAECNGQIVFTAFLESEIGSTTHTFTHVKKYPFKVYNWNEEEVSEASVQSFVVEEPLNVEPEVEQTPSTENKEEVVEVETPIEENLVTDPEIVEPSEPIVEEPPIETPTDEELPSPEV